MPKLTLRRKCWQPLRVLGLVAPLLVAMPLRAASPTFRVEVHPVETLTLNTALLLAGNASDATRATIAGELRLPFTGAARMPAVVMLHGDAGAVSNQVTWIEELNAAGIAVFTLDSFSGRHAISNATSLLSMPDSVGGSARVVDAERALALLASHPRIDPARIAVMGFSSGGRTALIAAQTRFARAFGTTGLHFSAYVALYPNCSVQLIDDSRSEPGPQRIFIGEADVVTSALACRKYVERLQAVGTDAQIATYANAHHGFDNVSNPDMTKVPEAPVTASCALNELEPGRIVNTETGQPFSMNDGCVGKGLVAGYNAAANQAARAAVKAFFVERFQLK